MKLSFSKEIKIILAVFACTVYLSLTGLSNHVFWSDEAIVGVMARTIVTTGHYSAWDGRNLLTIDNGRGLNDQLRRWTSPLEDFVAALGFKLFGISTWAGRFLFVIIGLFSLALFYLLLCQDFPAWYNFRIYAICLVALSYSFLLNIRQCLYYALCLFGVIALYYFYKKFLTTRSWLYGTVACAAALFFFFSNYLLAAAAFCALAVIHIVFHRKQLDKRQWIFTGVAFVVCCCVVIPYGIHERIWFRPYEASGATHSLFQRFMLFLWYVRELDGTVYLPGLLMAPFLGCIAYYWRRDIIPRRIVEYLCFVLAYVVFLSLFSQQWIRPVYPVPEIRYLVTIIPFAACCVGCFIAFLQRALGTTVATAVLIITLCTNLFSINISTPGFRLLLPAYIGEVHSHFESTLDVVTKYLNENVSKDEVVYCEPEHNLPVFNFYLGDRVYIGGTLRRNIPTASPTALAKCNRPLYIDEYFPDWIVLFSMMQDQVDIFQYFSRDKKYRYRPWRRLNVFCNDQTRPELSWHSFKPFTQYDPGQYAVYVFKRERVAEAK